jgi:MYXO-CTERM domain-containing protein
MKAAKRAVVALALMPTMPVGASMIGYEVTDLGSGAWRYSYTVTNDTLAVAVDEFTIYFEPGSYRNLTNPAAPVPWDAIAVEPDAALPDDGFFDAVVFDVADALLPGVAVAGFSIDFEFLGTGTPGAQQFDFFDSRSLSSALDTGTTQLAAVAVPEPPSPTLFVAALVALGLLRRRHSEGR